MDYEKIIEDCSIIENSGFFDKVWFVEEYDLEDDINPIIYYLEHGVELGLNPSHHFDTLWYLDKYPDVKRSDMNPFVHYIKYGVKEGRLPKKFTEEYRKKYSLFNDYNPCFFKGYDDIINDFKNKKFNDKINVGLFLKSNDGNFLPTAYIRLIVPFYHLYLEKNIQPYVFYGDDFKKIVDEKLFMDYKLFDVIIIQRDSVDEHFSDFLINLCQQNNTKLIYEIDDDLLGIDESHPNFYEFLPKQKVIKHIISNADAVTVSTNSLKNKLILLNSNVNVIHNTANLILNKENPIKHTRSFFKIGYMGSFTHENDIKLIESVIDNVKRYFSNKNVEVIFEIVGVTSNIINSANVVKIPENSKLYPNFTNWIKKTLDWDIGLAPLTNNDINSSKSEIKYIEYSSLGIPGIYSDVGAYSEVITDEFNGLLIQDNSISQWEDAIIKLIENDVLRETIINNSYEDIVKNFSVEILLESWSNLFENLLEYDKKIIFNKKNSTPLFTNPFFKEEYDLISEYKLVDEIQYLKEYPDVANNDISPIYHYLSQGIYEGCNPSAYFNTDKYVKNKNINIYETNPLIHYIKNTAFNFKFHFNDSESIENILYNLKKEISIIVPIYNAYDDVKNCINSVLKYSTKKFELILINDCSTDYRINELLDKYINHPDIRVVNNSENKGFVGTVNEGLKISNNDVILLNSDTIVTPKWLEKLTIAAYSNSEIATVTPFSNDAGAFSVPDIGKKNIIPDNLSLNEMSNIVEKVSHRKYMEVPTGNGFCLYIKRDAINSVGYFDEETFGRGYGEENDYCMRLIEKGWVNIIDDSTYIFHNKGSSFSSEREKLIKEHRKLLDLKHPSYTERVRSFVNSDTLKEMHDEIRFGLNFFNSNKFNRQNILFVIHSESGGTPRTNKDLMKYVEDYYNCFLLFAHKKIMILYHFSNGNLNVIKQWSFENEWWAENFYNETYKQIYFNVLVNLKIDLVHIRHLLHHSFDLPKIAKSLGIFVVLSFHDFYMVCPSFTLLDENYNYCAGECNDNLVNCQVPSQGITQNKVMKSFVNPWRDEVSHLFNYIDYFVTTSVVVKNLFIKIYPSLNKDNFEVIEHGRNFPTIDDKLFEIPSKDKPIKILFTGNILRHKGSKIIKEIHDLDIENNIEFHFLGSTDDLLSDIGIHHGTYERDELYASIAKIKPSFIGIFSIWPETFCHTLTEAWSCKIPVLATKIGVIEDRVRKNNGGIFIDLDDPLKSYEIIMDIKNDSKKYCEIQKNIEKIIFKSENEMGKEYVDIYKKLLQ